MSDPSPMSNVQSGPLGKIARRAESLNNHAARAWQIAEVKAGATVCLGCALFSLSKARSRAGRNCASD